MSRKIAVLAYGSLLAHPGEFFGKYMKSLKRCCTPFPVEYCRCAKGRGGAPTLVKSKNGSKVNGGLIILDLDGFDKNNIYFVKRKLMGRERTKRTDFIKHRDKLFRSYLLIYSDFPAICEKPNPECLAEFAISSVRECVEIFFPAKDGIRYLMENIEWGIETPLTCQYKEAILKRTGTKTLDEAETHELDKAYWQIRRPDYKKLT